MYYVGLFVLSAVVFRFYVFFRVFKMFLVGLATVVRLCFMSDIVLLIDWLYCIDLFSCLAASLFNKLTLLYFYFSDWMCFCRPDECVRRCRGDVSRRRHSSTWRRAHPQSIQYRRRRYRDQWQQLLHHHARRRRPAARIADRVLQPHRLQDLLLLLVLLLQLFLVRISSVAAGKVTVGLACFSRALNECVRSRIASQGRTSERLGNTRGKLGNLVCVCVN